LTLPVPAIVDVPLTVDELADLDIEDCRTSLRIEYRDSLDDDGRWQYRNGTTLIDLESDVVEFCAIVDWRLSSDGQDGLVLDRRLRESMPPHDPADEDDILEMLEQRLMMYQLPEE